MNAPLLPDEDKRLNALRQYQVLDTPPEQEFDDLTYLAAQICETPMAAVVLVDQNRQCFKSKVGFEGEESSREVSFCSHAILEHDLVVVPDATVDPRFADNPHVTGEPGLRFYAGMPLTTPQGHNIGTLCTFDTLPRRLTPDQEDALRRLGRQVMALLEARPGAPYRENVDNENVNKKESRQSRLQSEDRLKESEARYRRLFESAQDGILILDAASGAIEDVNACFCQLLEHPVEYFLGKQLWQIGIFVDMAANQTALHTLQTEGYMHFKELPLETRNGQTVCVEFASNVYAVGDKKVIQCNLRDISARKQSEEALHQGKDRLDFVIALAELGEWELNLLDQTASRSALHDRIFGYDAPAPDWTYEKFLDHVLPEDRDSVNSKFQAALELDQNWDFEANIRRTDGEVRTIWARGRIWRDEDGKPARMLGTVADITERKRAEEERERFLSVGSELLAIAGFDSRFKWVSPAWQRTFGWDTNELTAHPWLDFVHPEDHAPTINEAKRLFEGVETISFENRYRHRDGSYRWLSWKVKTYLREQLLYASATDITERKHNASALIERMRLAELNADIGRALIQSDNLDDMLHHCAETMVQHLDAAFARIWMLNHDTNLLELRASAGLYTHLDGPHSRVPVGQFKIGLIAQNRQAHLTNEVIGDPRVSDQDWARREGMVAFAGYPLLVEDQVIGVMALFARHTLSEATIHAMSSVANSVALGIERKRGDHARALLLESEQQSRQEAEATNRIKDEFLATLSHELRTPLNAILGWAHMLRAGQLDEADTVRAVETIERNARAQVQLIEDLLDVSRIITGKLRLNVRPLELAEVIQTAVDTVRPAAEAKNIRLQILLDPQAGPVYGDSERLQQVVWNLLTNAVKFTPKGGRVQIRLERVNSHVQMTVSDTGQGIDAEFLPHIFDRFRQADQTSTRAYGGLGLGLSIAHHLVELHGGIIDVESAGRGQGATFAVHLPSMAVIHDVQPEAHRHPTAGSIKVMDDQAHHCPPQLDQLRVLIVDDESDTRDLLRAILERCGSEVMVAASANEAFEMFTQWHPDVLISDVGMPQKDGYSLIREVRAWEQQQGGRVPAIALTAYARLEDRVNALQAGFQVHVSKPIEPIELMAVAASLAGRTTVIE